MTSSPARFLAVLLITALAVVGCGAPDDETSRPTATTTLPPELPTDLGHLPVGSGDVAPGDHVRVHGSVLRVNGHRVDLAPLRVDELAVVRGGVFFRNGTELWFTDLGRARATPYTDVRSLVASHDGGRFAFLDLQHGPKDRYGTPLAISIAYDAMTGKALAASYAGMGDVRTDDLGTLYEQGKPSVVAFDDDELVVRGADAEQHRIPLDVGAAQ